MTTVNADPVYLIGKSFSSCSVVGCTIAGLTGVLTLDSGSAGDLATDGTMDVFTFQRSRSLAQIQPINANIDNMVPISSNFTATVTEIRAFDGTSLLDDIAGAYDYVAVVVDVKPPGASSATHITTVYGVIESCETGAETEKNVTTLTMRPIGLHPTSG